MNSIENSAVQTKLSVAGAILQGIKSKNAARLRERTRKLDVALLISHTVVVVLVLGVIGISYHGSADAAGDMTHSALDQSSPSVDQIVAANLAGSVAQLARVSIEDNVANLSITLNAKTALAQTDDTMLNKPQIISQTGRDRITQYTAQSSDTVQSIAAKFGVSDDTIRWTNKLTSDALPAGNSLTILGTTGVLYTVKAGDSVVTLADKYKADKDRLITFNDLELTGLNTGQQVVIPDGILPENERPGYAAPRTVRAATVAGQITSLRVGTFGGNGYSYGYCTFYVYNRRAQLGRPIGGNWGNASSWAYYARADGFRVDNTPEVGAVMQSGGGWYGYGHVAVVEKVNPDGSIELSEMNYQAWDTITRGRVISAAQVRSYNYIH